MSLLHSHFKAKRVLQADWISEESDWYVLNEVKNQEPYKSPPFDGQGLDIYQIQPRLDFYKKTGIRCRLIVFNPLDKSEILWQWLDVLEQGKHHDTKIKQKRIYPIESFQRISDATRTNVQKMAKDLLWPDTQNCFQK